MIISAGDHFRSSNTRFTSYAGTKMATLKNFLIDPSPAVAKVTFWNWQFEKAFHLVLLITFCARQRKKQALHCSNI
jgi:hypothetical protein